MDTHTILIVDDDADIRETVAEALEDEGYSVDRAANGREALEHLRTAASPCIILLDLMMPVMDGFQFRAAQQSEPAWAAIPVVVVSAGGHCREAAGELGAVACVRKPFTMTDLLSAVERFC